MIRTTDDTMRYCAKTLVMEAARLERVAQTESDRQTAQYALRQLKDALSMLRLCRDREASQAQMSLPL